MSGGPFARCQPPEPRDVRPEFVVHLARICPISKVETLVTDSGAAEAVLAPFREAGVGVVVA